MPYTSMSTNSKIDDPGLVFEELSTVLCDLSRNTVGIFDILLAKLLEDTTQAVVPLLPLVLCFARIGGSELNQKLLTYRKEVSLRTGAGRTNVEYETLRITHH